MPYYDYSCRECGSKFELKLPITEVDAPTKDPCPKCFKTECVEVVLGAPAIGYSMVRPPADFQKYLGRMKEKFPGSTIGKNSRFNIPREI
jgi:putative FmdB family regulatory protein